jgi:hypothetical protein
MPSQQKEPPAILVKTWVELLRTSPDEDVRQMVAQRLVEAFGDMKLAAEFCKKHNIK